nr:type II secretion system minor pseudopilin GspK [Burkholderiaceae bacterium]
MMRAPCRCTQTPALRCGQRGVAVLMALFVSALATIIVAGLFWTQFVLLRTIENQQLVSQSRLLLHGALDWARAILREDARTTAFDACEEPWAQKLQETSLEALGETSTLASQAIMSGDIEDAQSRLNLRALVVDGQVFEPEVQALKRLVSALGLPPQTAELVAAHVAQSVVQTADGQALGRLPAGPRPIALVMPSDIAGIPGISAPAARRLADYLVVFDEQWVPININTVSAEVLYARVPDLSLSEAKRLVSERQSIGRFRDVGDFRNRLGAKAAGVSAQQVATASRYFFIRGRIQLGRADTRMEALGTGHGDQISL